MNAEIKDVLNDIQCMSYNILSMRFWNALKNKWYFGIPDTDKQNVIRVQISTISGNAYTQVVTILEKYGIRLTDRNITYSTLEFSCDTDSDIIPMISQALHMRRLHLKEEQLDVLNQDIMKMSTVTESLRSGLFSKGVKNAHKRIKDLIHTVMIQQTMYNK